MFARTVLLTAIAALACGETPRPARDATHDDLGRPLPEMPVARIVSLNPVTTELLFAIGAEEHLVGRTQWAAYPPEVATIPDVGDAFNPNLEQIVAQRPDVVVFYASSSNDQAVARLDGLGIASVSLRTDSLGSIPWVTRTLGRLTGREDAAERVAAAFQAQLDSARAATPPGSGLRVAILSWGNPPIVIGAGSFLSELLELAGAQNVFDDLSEASATVTVEVIADRAPDVFLSFGDQPPAYADRPEWQAVQAVRDRRIARVVGPEFLYPSPRSFAAVARLRAALAEVR